MRLFILLAAVAVAVLKSAPKSNKIELDKFDDGTLITFWFKHQANTDITDSSSPNYNRHLLDEPVFINFFNTPNVVDPSDTSNFDATLLAHFRVSGQKSFAVQSSKWENGGYATAKQPGGAHGSDYLAISLPEDQTSDVAKTSDGGTPYWRFDVYKHDKHKLSVFFQGYWSQVREFNRILDGVKSIYLFSDFVDHKNVHIYVKTNSKLPVPTWYVADQYMAADTKKYYRHIEFSKFPEGTSIEMAVVLKASQPSSLGTASLGFWTNPGNSPDDPFFRIVHIYTKNWQKNNLEPWITTKPSSELNYYTKETKRPDAGVLCGEELMVNSPKKPYGDFQHFLLTRGETTADGMTDLKLRTFFAPKDNVESGLGTECKIKVEAKYLDNPFSIWGTDQGSMILHLETDAPIQLITDIPKFPGEAP